MLETVKSYLWELLEEKDVSLAMIFDKNGAILWHKGRNIAGKNVHNGQGFCKSYILSCLQNTASANTPHGENEPVFRQDTRSESAVRLLVKSVLILPVTRDFYVYVDSGTKRAFSHEEVLSIKMLGKILGDALEQTRKKENDVNGITGDSEAITNIKELVLRYSLEEEPILLLGETGVGKSHIAGLIHRYSGRKGKFVVADVTTVNENLFESYVFGHTKGSFTGAVCNKKGLIDEARGGTLFLDEVGEVPVSFQAKLLRFIETKRYRVLGEAEEREADVRIITATNKDLPECVEDKEFREDLYFRLNVLTVKIPPLRERKEDLKAIVEEKKKYLKGKRLGEDFWETLYDYHWPGNFRELLTTLKRVGILYASPITGEDVRAVIDERLNETGRMEKHSEMDRIWKELQSGKCFWDAVKRPFLDRDLNRVQVKNIVSRVLSRCGGRYVDALPMLNVEPSDYKKLMRFLYKNRLQ